jgi:hypothetical protein
VPSSGEHESDLYLCVSRADGHEMGLNIEAKALEELKEYMGHTMDLVVV